MHACAARSWCPVCFACVLCDCVFLYILFFSSLFCALFILRFVFFLLNQSRSRRFRGRHIVGIRSFVYCVEPFFYRLLCAFLFAFSSIQRCPSINAKRMCWCWIALVCEFRWVLSVLSASLLFFHLCVLCCVI